MDSSSNNIVEIDNFITHEECELLIDYFKRSPRRFVSEDDFWDNRVVPCGRLSDNKIRVLVEAIQYRVAGKICGYYEEDYIYPNFSNIVYWGPDMELTPHCDNMHIYHPKREHNTAYRDYSAVLCLNEDYVGGHTIFPELDTEYAGKTGRLIIFPSGRSHLHGVTEVTSGKRYTFALWYTKQREKLFYINNGNSLSIWVVRAITSILNVSKRLFK